MLKRREHYVAFSLLIAKNRPIMQFLFNLEANVK